MEQLCSFIAIERDPAKFIALVKELNDLLESSHHQLAHPDIEKRGR